MKKIYLPKKSGFEIVNPNEPVIIRDDRMKLFYTTEPYLPKIKTFNLPGGFPLYLDRGNIRKLPRPIKQKMKPLPRFQRFRKMPHNFNVDFGNNPNKCSIIWPLKTILFDHSFKEKTLPECYFILYHEFGHHLYKDEEKADLYAKNMMLNKGYNQSQIASAIMTALNNERNFYRKENLVDNLI